MVAGKPIFPGTSTLDQIEKIMTIIPTPSRQGNVAVGKISHFCDVSVKLQFVVSVS